MSNSNTRRRKLKKRRLALDALCQLARPARRPNWDRVILDEAHEITADAYASVARHLERYSGGVHRFTAEPAVRKALKMRELGMAYGMGTTQLRSMVTPKPMTQSEAFSMLDKLHVKIDELETERPVDPVPEIFDMRRFWPIKWPG